MKSLQTSFVYAVLSLLLGTLITGFLSCAHREQPVLQRADALLSTDSAERAAALLDSVQKEVATWNKADRMRHALLSAEAQNKRFIPFTDDSLLLAVVDYYEKEGTPFDQMRAYYVMGSVYRDLQWSTQAQKYYHKAIEKADTTDIAQVIRLARVYGQLGDIYLRIRNLQNALEMYKHQSLYGKKSNNISNELDGLFKQAECVAKLNDRQLSIEMVLQCEELYRNYGLKSDADACLKTLANFYTLQKDYKNARKYFELYEKISGLVDDNYYIQPIRNREYYYLSKGNFYNGIGKVDSALLFYYRLYAVEDNLCKQTASRSLYLAYKKNGKKDSVIKYQTKYINYIRNSNKEQQTSQLQELQSHFDITTERERAKREADRATKNQHLMWVAIFGAIVSVLAAILFIRNIADKNKIKQQKWVIQYQMLQHELEEAKRKIKESSSTENIDGLLLYTIDNLKNRKHDEFEADTEKVRFIDKMLLLESSAVKNMYNIYNNLYTVKDKDWILLMDACMRFNSTFGDFLSANKDLLSEKEIRICMMIYADFTPKMMSYLLSTSKQNITSIRSRLYSKLYGERGSAKDLDDKIRAM